MSIIRVNDVTKHYALGNQTVEALRGITFEINKGEFIAIMGPSGSGKSTLMNIIGCLDTPTSGQYYLNDQEVSTMDGRCLGWNKKQRDRFCFPELSLVGAQLSLR
jgi:putative ABC transport system ATP-binding protein